MSNDIYMPQLGLTMTEGKVLRWLKAPGDRVARGEPVVEIETDKVTAEVEAPAAGILGPILADADAVVPIGGILSHVLAPSESMGAGPSRVADTRAQADVALGEAPARVSAAGLLAPASEGAGEPRLFATPRARRKAAELGIDLRQVEASGPGGRIVEADVRYHADQVRRQVPAGARPEAAVESKPALAEPAAPRVSPLARRLAEELGVDLSAVTGSGPGGRVVEADVHRHAALAAQPRPVPAGQAGLEPPSGPKPVAPVAGRGPAEPLRGIRRVMAERMTQSFTTAPHFYLSVETEVLALVRMREGLMAKVEAAAGVRLTISDILVKVCGQALAEHPDVNVAWDGSVPGGAVVHLAEANVGLAVSLDTGLVVPVIRRADGLTLAEIAKQRADLTERAREGKLALADLEGGTFTLSNLGMYGVDQFQAILNPPQAAILAVGRVKDRPVAVDSAVVVRPTMHLTLSADHRLLDGAQAARFLERVAQLIQEPYLLVE